MHFVKITDSHGRTFYINENAISHIIQDNTGSGWEIVMTSGWRHHVNKVKFKPSGCTSFVEGEEFYGVTW